MIEDKETSPKPYNWEVRDPKWIKWILNHELFVDYSDPDTWEPKNWGVIGRKFGGGPPVCLNHTERLVFWYVDRKNIAKRMLSGGGKRHVTLSKRGEKYAVLIGRDVIWTTEFQEVGEAAVLAFNAGDVARMLAIEPQYVNLAVKDKLTQLAKAKYRKLTAEDFALLQQHKADIGRVGELIALKEERQRVMDDYNCPEPENCVMLLAESHVGAGYDIESVFPGHERYIEVKSSTNDPKQFFITKNERDTLISKGAKGWIYFVKVDQDMQGGVVVSKIQDPLGTPSKVMLVEPSAWKASLKQ